MMTISIWVNYPFKPQSCPSSLQLLDKLTFCVWISFSRDLPLNKNTQQSQHRPNSHDHPCEPTHWARRIHLHPLIDIPCQSEELDKIIHSHSHHSWSEDGGGEGGETALPLQREHSKQHSRAQQHTQGKPHCPRVIKLLQNHQRGQGHQ